MTEALDMKEPEEFPAVPVEEVEKLLSTMGKALRAFHMYQENNTVFQRFRTALHEAFADIWLHAAELPVAVTEDGFRYDGRTFSVGQGRDSLPFAFYKDGIRSLTFLPGFESEVESFLEAVTRAMRSDQEVDDLISVLWEQDFGSLQYGYVDLLMEGVPIPEDPLKEPGPLDLSFAIAAEEEEEDGEEGDGAPAAKRPLQIGLSADDFDETLYFLSQAEMAALQTEVAIEMDRELRRDVLNALFDRIEEPRPERQAQILDILDQLLPLFLSRGDMRNAGVILEELDRLQGAGGALDPELRDRVDRLFVRLSDPDVLEQFVQAVEDGAVLPESDEVNLFFSRLHAEALPILIRFAEMSESERVQTRLSSAIDGLAARYPTEVSELLTSDERAVAMGAARVAGRVGLAQAVPGLQAALESPDRDLRMAVVEALVAIRATPALHALCQALDDDDRDVRVAAAKSLGAVRFASARPALEKAISGKQLRDADLTERMAFFETYGAVGGSAAVGRLDDLLNSRRFLGRRSPTEVRACAALGLGQVGTADARRALERARSDDDPIVRNAVLRALKEETVSR